MEEAAEALHYRIGGGENLPMKNLLSLEKVVAVRHGRHSRGERGDEKERGHHAAQPLPRQTWALLFSKSSTRTRVSLSGHRNWAAGDVSERGGNPTGAGEPIKDTTGFGADDSRAVIRIMRKRRGGVRGVFGDSHGQRANR